MDARHATADVRIPTDSAGLGVVSPVEAGRMAAVHRYSILDTPHEGAFDRVAALAARFFRVPIATISIVDTERIWFKATHGLDIDEVGRDPGLCASVIMQDEPYAMTDAADDPRAVGNPLVTGPFGLRFYAAAPIVTPDGFRLGTVNVIDRKPRSIQEDELTTLTELAAMVVDELELRLATLNEVQAERHRREEVQQEKARAEHIAHTLQQTLLPPHLPRIPDLELGAFYHPSLSADVGGDFYDVFPLSEGNWAVTIGDVSGKGVEAAALTSLARYTLRGAAIQTDDPAQVIASLNETVVYDQRAAAAPRYCTAIFGVVQPHPGGAVVRMSNAGHPPAVVCRTDGSVERHTASGPMVGWLPGTSYPTVEVFLEPGDALLLYTDGITDARRYGQRFGEGRLAAALADRPRNNARALVEYVKGVIARFDPPTDDDLALFALSVPER